MATYYLLTFNLVVQGKALIDCKQIPPLLLLFLYEWKTILFHFSISISHDVEDQL